MKYRKTPVEVEAVQFKGMNATRGKPEFSEEQPDWLQLAFSLDLIRKHPLFPETRLQIEELDSGAKIVDAEDWVVCVTSGSEGRPAFRVYKPDAFKAQFESADTDIRGWEDKEA